MVLDIVTYSNDNRGFLRRKNIDVIKNDHSINLIGDMFDTIAFNNLNSLSAPQVRKNLNLFIISFGDFNETFINPKMMPYGSNIQISETCSSIPGIKNVINIKSVVKIEYTDRSWIRRYKTFDHNLARIIQHEFEHLNGILIIDH